MPFSSFCSFRTCYFLVDFPVFAWPFCSSPIFRVHLVHHSQLCLHAIQHSASTRSPRCCPACRRYWHRSLNPKKLIEVKFSQLSRNMTMQRTLKLHRLPAETETEGFRRLTPADVPAAMQLLNDVSSFAERREFHR